jgi:thiamine-phosphate pyrophosphorylase
LGADAAPIETLRYQGYALGQRLMLALPTGRCPQWRLCVLISESLCKRPWLDVARAAVEGGADCLQLREKDLEDRELLARAERLVELARAPGVPQRIWVIVNDRVDVALASGADGVHLGQTDMQIDRARRVAGLQLLVGVSTTNLVQAHAAAGAGADYCGVGPMFPTTTKEKPSISGPAYLREYLADPACGVVPHLAIGGITPLNVATLREVGCRGVAISSAVCSAADPDEVCRGLVGGLQE